MRLNSLEIDFILLAIERCEGCFFYDTDELKYILNYLKDKEHEYVFMSRQKLIELHSIINTYLNIILKEYLSVDVTEILRLLMKIENEIKIYDGIR